MSTHAKITNIFHICHILSEKKKSVCLSTILVPKDFTQYEQGKFYITLAQNVFTSSVHGYLIYLEPMVGMSSFDWISA